MEFSTEINELATALAKAQAEMGNAKKSSNNPFFHSKYADLAEVLDTCREVLSKNGLSVVQPVGQVTERNIEVHTVLMHTSGQWIKSSMNIPMVKIDPQAAGSAITYARRYSLAAMVGIAQADDDAESAMVRESVQSQIEPPFSKFDNGVLMLKSKKNGRWADARNVTLQRLNDMLNDKDYAQVHKIIMEIMEEKSK